MSCKHCGCPTPRSRLCKQCSIESRIEDRVKAKKTQPDPMTVECSRCALLYVDDHTSMVQCPCCGETMHRTQPHIDAADVPYPAEQEARWRDYNQLDRSNAVPEIAQLLTDGGDEK